MDLNPNDLLNEAARGFGWATVWAAVGRGLAHAHLVQSGQRKVFSPALFWEIPIAIGMARVGMASAELLEVGPGNVRDAIVITVGYLGPRIFERAFEIVSQRFGYNKKEQTQ